MEQSAIALRGVLSGLSRGRGKRVPDDLKARVRVYVMARRKQDATFVQIGEELGLPMESVRRWTLTSPKAPAHAAVPVHVVAEPGGRVSIVSPSGYRLEGLTLQDAVAVLRALG
ncbi:MAG TPA: hypothetical protein VNC62_06440 [Burkholderiales bacterium]|nr:hypothetical protein [Burkholderiales bacterium]